MTGRTHGYGNDPYYVRRRMDYFVRHLLGVEPAHNQETRTTTTSSQQQ